MSKQALQPYDAGQDAIIVSEQGKQDDNAVSVSKGIVLQALPVIGLSLPLSIGICALAWLSGIVQAGFVAYVVSVLVIWGGFSLFCYNVVARRSHDHSYYGTERLKIQNLTDLKRQELSQDFHLKQMALSAYIKRLEGNTDE
ncbi:MAG: hypothetical protein KDE31_35025 [Caldilineaceae bacterium]|nr:hypothetical protein [Caldilineaceae bacterium]